MGKRWLLRSNSPGPIERKNLPPGQITHFPYLDYGEIRPKVSVSNAPPSIAGSSRTHMPTQTSAQITVLSTMPRLELALNEFEDRIENCGKFSIGIDRRTREYVSV